MLSTMRRITNLILAVTTVVLLSGCIKELEVGAHDTTNMQYHVDASQNLKRVMHDMNSVLYEHHKSELERDEQRQRYAFKLSDKLITLSQEIKKYPQKRDQEHFMTLADQLKVHGENIRSIASIYNMKVLNEEIQNMTRTCNNCHAKFNPNGPKIQ